MHPRTSATTRTLRAELLYLLYSRTILVAVAVISVGVVAAFFGSVSAARSADAMFVHQVKTYERNGITLEQALSLPVTVTTDGSAETIDNPLKYDYLQVGTAVHAVDGVVPFIGTALDLVTFIVVPLLMIALGLYSATTDRRTGTLRLKATRDRWSTLVTAKLASLAVLAVALTAAAALLAAVVALVGSPIVDGMHDEIAYTVVEPTSTSPLALKLAMTAGVAMFFGVVGYATGTVTGASSWPLAIFALLLFVLPFVSVWDPRNLLAIVGSHVFDYWGQFKMRPPLPLETPTAVVALTGYLAIAAGIAALLPTARRRFG